MASVFQGVLGFSASMVSGLRSLGVRLLTSSGVIRFSLAFAGLHSVHGGFRV